MSNLKDHWQQLETQSGAFPHIRYDANSPCDLYLGVKRPENQRLMALRLPIGLVKAIKNHPPSKGIVVEKVKDTDDANRFFLNMVLTDRLYTDVFDILLTDLIKLLLPVSEPKQATRLFISQLTRWEDLFSRFSANGLSEEQQKGLFGELYVLQNLLVALPDSLAVLESWVGNEAAAQDFQANDWAIEVKTSSHTTHERFTVNGEGQLDDSGLKHLFLYYLNISTITNGGKRLPDLIAGIRKTLSDDLSTLSIFNQKLVKAGYFDTQAEHYQGHSYTIRHEQIFNVTADFPRILPHELRAGIGGVHYTVTVASCQPYRISETELIKTLSFSN